MNTESAQRVIEVENVSKSFDSREVVASVSLELEKGEILAILGPNGAGKTTLLRMILDIIKPDNGSISLFGQSFSPAHFSRIGYLPEERGLYKNASVIDMLLYFTSLKGMSAKLARRKIDEMLTELNLEDYKGKKTGALSKGMLHKLQLVTALLHGPELLVLDEPFAGLDPVGAREVSTIISGEKEKGRAIILSTHQMNLAQRLADRILLIHEGKAVLEGDLEMLIKDMEGKIPLSPERIAEIEHLKKLTLEDIFIYKVTTNEPDA